MLGKHTLKPGERTELIAIFATKNAPGPFEKIITIETDVSGQAQIELVMTGTVKETPGPKIAVTPRRIDIGIIKQTEIRKQKVTVTNPGEVPLTITAASTMSGSSINVAVGSLPLTIGPGQTVEVELAITVAKLGKFSERTLIESNAKNAPRTGFVIQLIGKAE